MAKSDLSIVSVDARGFNFMAEYQVTCVTKSSKRCDCITHLAGPGWTKSTVAQVVGFIENGHRFYTQVVGAKAYLEVVNANPKYVRTEKDGTERDNLLSLPTCPT